MLERQRDELGRRQYPVGLEQTEDVVVDATETINLRCHRVRAAPFMAAPRRVGEEA
jgi:hypothetical protein